MTLYEYRCRTCGQEYELVDIPSTVFACVECGEMVKRVFSFNMQSVMHDHYNPSTGSVISSRRQHADELKRQSEAATIRTGILHNFVPVDPADAPSVFNITDEGLDATRARQVEQGKRSVQRYYDVPTPPAPLPKPASADTV